MSRKKKQRTSGEYRRKLIDRVFTLILLIIIFVLILFVGYAVVTELQQTNSIVEEVQKSS